MRSHKLSVALMLSVTFLLGAPAARSAFAAASDQVQCVSVSLPRVQLLPDPQCRIASHPLTATALKDVSFLSTPTAGCFATAPTDAVLTDPSSGQTYGVTLTVVSGTTTNAFVNAGIQPLPIPLFDVQGRLHIYSILSAASVMEVRSKASGKVLGQLVTRDAGYIEINPVTQFPAFASEKLVVTYGEGSAFNTVSGEIYISGDEFAGAPGAGSLCGKNLVSKVFDK